jgi:hypothetical protein
MGMNSINKKDIGNLQRDGFGVSLMRINEHNRVFFLSYHIFNLSLGLFSPPISTLSEVCKTKEVLLNLGMKC